MTRYLDFIKAICRESKLPEIDNPRVVAMIHNIIQCVQNEENLDKETRDLFIDIVLSNLIIFGKYDAETLYEKK